MKGIKRLGPGRYKVRVTKVCPRSGTRHYRRETVRGSRQDAIDKRAELLAELDDLIHGRVRIQPTLTDYAKQWIELRATRLKPSTAAKYVNDLEKHILPVLGNHLVTELRPSDIQALLNADRGAPNSCKNRLGLLRAMSKDALADGLINRDFCARVTVKVPRVYTDDEPNLLNPGQVHRLLQVIRQYWLDVACTMSFTGLRWGEVSALHWDDLNLDEAWARVCCNNWKGVLFETPKNDRAARVIPLADPLPELLAQRHRRMVAEEHPGLERGLVFPTRTGGLHKGSPLNRVLRVACDEVGIAIRLTSHGLRRTWNDIARRVASGIVVRAMIGHGSEAMTEHYSRIELGEKREVADTVAQLMTQDKTSPLEADGLRDDLECGPSCDPRPSEEGDEGEKPK